MKNNHDRASHNGDKKPRPSQAQTNWRKACAARRKLFGPEFRLPKDAKDDYCLALFDRKSSQLCSRVPLSEDEFSALWNTCLKNTLVKRDVPFRPVVTLAGIIRVGLVASAECGWSELELNVTKVASLMQLLSDKLDHIRTNDSEFSGRDVATLCAGVNLLVADAKKNLRAAFDKTFHAVNGGNP